MKALTIYQPWASLIMAGAKPYEFRGWSPRLRGRSYAALIGQRIVIHAAARPMVAEEIRGIVDRLQMGFEDEVCLHKDAALAILLPLYHLKKPDGLPLSAGLGTAILGEPRNGYDIAAEFGGEAVNDSDRDDHANFGWPMQEVERWDAAAPMRGFQGFWNWPTPAEMGL